ncbi:NAD(P)H-dependent oxidoreductase [Haliangium sp.]|uniref:NAD(P)H-dependent oxidoreductase n=1 Tax=Haliangium sp. TaxID=2663208 RepID=UPI003D124638
MNEHDSHQSKPLSLALLDGLPTGSLTGAIRAELADTGKLGVVHALGSETFAPCQGCWQCWVAQPGTCKATDAANTVMHDIIGADAVLWTTKLRFGCWSAVTKAALDKSIGLVSPFFTTIDGETHHRKRYRRYPRWGALAVVDAGTTARERELFATLVARNAINIHSEAPWVGFVSEDADEAAVREVVAEGVRALGRPAPAPSPDLGPYPGRTDAIGVPPVPGRARHVVLWVGSAKPRGQSTSESLGQHLVAGLERRGWTSEIVHVARMVRLGRDRAPGLVEAFRRADLVILSTPVYVDSLPALVLNGLSCLAGADLGERPPALLPIIQCGFPELVHTALAVEISALAADRIGLGWAGHLAMGAGGMIDGAPLSERASRLPHQIQALDDAAEALDQGRPLSASVIEAFSQVSIPPGLYRFLGQIGWVASAYRHGAVMKLWDKPFDEAQPRGGDSHE